MRFFKKLQHWHLIAAFLMIYDAIAVNLSHLLALLLRYDFRYSMIPEEFVRGFVRFAPVYTVTGLLIFSWLNLYRSIWRFASYTELSRIIVSSTLCLLVQIVGIFVNYRMPISYYVIGAFLQFVFVVMARFSYRFVLLLRNSRRSAAAAERIPHIMLIGAGNAGQMILRDVQNDKEVYGRISCIIDDNPNKWGRFIDGIPIVGGRNDIPDNVGKYNIERIYLAIPSAPKEDQSAIIDICKETGCSMKILPGIYQFAMDQVTVSNLKEVSIEDLLGREPVRFDMQAVKQFIYGKTILVTGGGGSIGSELCRQIAKYEPNKLIIFDIYENNAYDIQMELQRDFPLLDLVVLIGSVRDGKRLKEVFEEYRPQVVYHAAAHKHVPLMEDSPCEAIKNNAIGTYKTAYIAMAYGCEKFVLISTDKAVNPVNVMGASKRICEKIIQSFDYMIREGKPCDIPAISITGTNESVPLLPDSITTKFIAVRFGNVLGSNGSVIPLFKKQIEMGGPVTVTSKDIIRYFMTIPEAVSLVLEAGVIGKSSEILVLDMGEPVKIDTLARNLIKLSGLKPDEDIKIEYIGLRPGEKLFEEKLMAEEGILQTENKLIYIGKPVDFDKAGFLKKLIAINDAANNNNEEATLEGMRAVVPTFTPAKND